MKLRNTKTGETLTIKGDWEIIPDESENTAPIHTPYGPGHLTRPSTISNRPYKHLYWEIN